MENKQDENFMASKPMLGDVTHRGMERRKHTGIYGIVSLGRGRQLGSVDCPFCGEKVPCYLWSISGGGKKCKCGAIIHRTSAERNIT